MGVLDGIKILEVARVAPAEMPGMMLADMGADVLKIETPGHGEAGDAQANRRAAFAFVNRNKRSMTLNMKAPEGQAIFRTLAKDADVIVEGFRPGVMKRLGADYETIRALNPRIVYCSLSGFGQDGPYRDYPAHDMNYLSLAGVLGLIGEADRKPAIPLNLVADYAGASLHGALGIMLALFGRERTGRGQHVDVSYLDTTLSLLAATPNMRFFFSDGQAPAAAPASLAARTPTTPSTRRATTSSSPSAVPSPGSGRISARPSAGQISCASRANPTSSCARPTRRKTPPARRSRPSSGGATATTGTSTSRRPTSAWARCTTRRRSSRTLRFCTDRWWWRSPIPSTAA